MKFIPILALLFLLSGCTTAFRAKGGTSKHLAATGTLTEVTQSENPKEPTTSQSASVVEEEIILPAGTSIETISVDAPPKTEFRKQASAAKTNTTRIVLSSPTPYKRRVSDESHIKQGGSWKDTVGEVVAKMSAAKPLQILGVVVCLLGAAMFTPWARPFVGSTTTPVITIGVGIALVAMPYLIIGNEGKITGAIAGLAAIPLVWWLAHRHGSVSATAKVYKDFLDANKNGIDDRSETNASPKAKGQNENIGIRQAQSDPKTISV